MAVTAGAASWESVTGPDSVRGVSDSPTSAASTAAEKTTDADDQTPEQLRIRREKRERILSEGFHVEGPTWAPNGRVLMFFKDLPAGQGRNARLYSVDVTGFNERRVSTPLDASDPAWSPLIP